MKKKGFTIIEIIISISIILIVGVSTTMFVINNKNNKELITKTKEILEAANLYAGNEVDETGNIFINEVRNGRSGVKIPLANLVNKGYIKEELKDEVIDLSNKGTSHNYYIMLLTNKEYCDGSVFSLASWVDEDVNKEVYLCNKVGGGETDKSFYEHLEEKYDLFAPRIKSEITKDDYESIYTPNNETQHYTGRFINIKSNDIYCTLGLSGLPLYFRGNISDNYVKIENDLFRIVNFDSNRIKLITDEAISSNYYNNAEGEEYKVKKEADGRYNNNFHSSKLKNTLDNWLSESSLKSFVYKTTNFGEDTNLKSYSYHIGLLSEYETNLAGPIGAYEYIEYQMETMLVLYAVSMTSYLVPDFNKTRQTIIFSANSSGVSGLCAGDTFVRSGIIDSNCTNWKYLRPVISLDINEIKFTGSGTKRNPYVFEPK